MQRDKEMALYMNKINVMFQYPFNEVIFSSDPEKG